MKWFVGRLMGGFALVLLLASGCSDSDLSGPEVSPPPEAMQSSALLSGIGDALVNGDIVTLPAVARLVPQLRDLSMTEVVGPRGGVVRAGGVVLRIPAGALERPTAITVVQPAGVFVQGFFLPHGLRFLEPAMLTFDLGGTNAADKELVGAYYDTPLVGGLIPAKELLPARVENGSIRFRIEHFSGYAPAFRGYTASGG